jgi:hypothetical protein
MSDNEEHPAHEAIVDILYNIRTAIKGSSSLPAYMDGPLISIPMTKEQAIILDAQVRTLRGIETMIIERYPGAIHP